MSNESIRVVIRKPFHPMLKQLSEQLNIDDYGELVNYILLEFQRRGGDFSESVEMSTKKVESSLANKLAAMF